MAATRSTANKAKIARRVVEVLEYFDDEHPEATVMDIVRRYDRPQSSTSELLSSLVELGLLHKDPYARSYRPTARAALLGATSQQGAVRDGRLIRLLDRLAAQTGLPVLLVAKTGLDVQIVTARQGNNARLRRLRSLLGGQREPLSQNAAGWLLLSTLPEDRREPTLRRLNSEATEDEKFNASELLRTVNASAETGLVAGRSGFGMNETMLAMLLPEHVDEEALVACIVLDKPDQQGPLTQCLKDAVDSIFAGAREHNVKSLATAA
ncbi:MAG: helix-turn-helix domain-containing protein [Novosphingobium sp.]|nr:helix-turn-helix domain-containing protein [Novosphingobium sp.]